MFISQINVVRNAAQIQASRALIDSMSAEGDVCAYLKGRYEAFQEIVAQFDVLIMSALAEQELRDAQLLELTRRETQVIQNYQQLARQLSELEMWSNEVIPALLQALRRILANPKDTGAIGEILMFTQMVTDGDSVQ